ncbi:MAG: AAC(3) family N-acetyltransferase [Candidatus Zixiibacteriota bacterium]
MRFVRTLIHSARIWCRKHLPETALDALRALSRCRHSRSKALNRKNSPLLKLGDLAADLRSAGFRAGDVIMVHSSLSSIGRVEGGAATVIASLIELLTDEGTLIMPCYNSAGSFLRNLKHGKMLDLRTSPSATGKITEVFRAHPGVLRSSHPFSSSCAIGKHAEYATNGHEMAPEVCHADSPVGRLVELKGKVVGIGISIAQGLGVAHYMEDTWEGFPFEVHTPKFPVKYINSSCEMVERDVCRFDPGIARTRIDYPEGAWICEKLAYHLARKGILERFKFGDAESWVMQADVLYEELKRLATKHVTMYLTEDKLTDENRDTESW